MAVTPPAPLTTTTLPAHPQARTATSAPLPTTTIPAHPEAHATPPSNAPSLLSATEPLTKKAWELQQGGFTASRLAIARRLRRPPRLLLADARELPSEPRAFLWRLARDTYEGLRGLSDARSGLAVDNVRFVGGMVPPLALRIGDYTNVTNIGLQLAAIAGARAIGLETEFDARRAALQILDTLAHLPRYEGQFYNYYDTTSLEATSTLVSFVDTGWLVAGLLVTRQAFPDLEPFVDELLAPIDFALFYDAETKLMSHGYYTKLGSPSTYHYGAFYTEARLASLIAVGKGDATKEHWYAMRRAYLPRCPDSECPRIRRFSYDSSSGAPMHVSHFRWKGFRYVPSWGGSMFEALMPTLFVDEQRYAPQSLGPNGAAHATIQRLFATEMLGLPVWGMSPSIDPESGRYGEFGVSVLGSHGYASDVVAPYAAALALAVTPDDAVRNLMVMAQRYRVYGEYGFYDAIDAADGIVAFDYLALDQAMLFLAVANHLSGGEIQDLFAADPFVAPALALLAEERFFE